VFLSRLTNPKFNSLTSNYFNFFPSYAFSEVVAHLDYDFLSQCFPLRDIYTSYSNKSTIGTSLLKAHSDSTAKSSTIIPMLAPFNQSMRSSVHRTDV